MPRPERPLDGANATALTRFAIDLRALRDAAGRPNYRRLAADTGYSVTTLSDAAAGRALPTLPVTTAYVRACGGDTDAWQQRWHEVAAELAANSTATGDPESAAESTDEAAESADDPAPYIGLAAFEASDASWFFGREDLVTDLVARVGTRRFVAVFGASGAGKSSILRAGLIPAWTARGTRTTLCTPGARPVAAYDAALDRLGRDAGDALLVVDQFEEIFTVCQDESERDIFLHRLLTDIRDDDRPRVVIGVRTDFYEHCATDAGLAAALQDSQFLVGPMTVDQLRSAITRPAVLAGGTVQTALLAALIADCAGQPGVLPLLSHALRETWRRRSGTCMTLDGYQATGGITHAVAQTAEHTYAGLDTRGQWLARSLFLRLTALGDETADTKRRVDTAELDADPDLTAVLDRLTAARLITVDGEHVEITHEALIRSWPRLRDWLTTDREGLRVHRQLSQAATEWDALHRDRGALYRGTRLSIARDWAGGPIELSGTEREFLAASTEEETRQHVLTKRRTTRLRALVCLLSVLVIAAGTLSVVAVRAQGQAQAAQDATAQQRDQAVAAAMLQRASALADSDPQTAAQLDLAAYRVVPAEQERGALLAESSALQVHNAPLPGQLLGVSPNGRLAATGDPGGTVSLFALDPARHTASFTGQFTVGAGETTTEGVAFSPNGRLLVTEAFDGGKPEVWNVANPARPALLATLPQQGSDAYFGSDRFLLTEGTSFAVWDLADPRAPRQASSFPFDLSLGDTDATVLSDDGRTAAQLLFGRTTHLVLWNTGKHGPATMISDTPVPGGPGDWLAERHGLLAVVTTTGLVQLSRVTPGHAPVPLGTIEPSVNGFGTVGISQDGTELAVTTKNLVQVWNVTSPANPQPIASVATHSPSIPQILSFESDHRLVIDGVQGDWDSQVQWIDLPALGLTAAGHWTGTPSFSQDGGTLAVSDATTGTTSLWNVSEPTAASIVTTLPEGTVSGQFSPARHLVAAAGPSGTRLWDASNPAKPRPAGTLPAAVTAFSPDGRQVLDTGHTVWDISQLPAIRRIGSLPANQNTTGPAAFSRDGSTIATAGPGRILLFRVTANAVHQAGSILFPSTSVGFAGNTLVATSYGGRAGLWDVSDPARPRLLSTVDGVGGGKTQVVINSRGTLLALADEDGTTQLWDVTAPRNPRSFAVLTDAAPMAFDPDGRTIAVQAGDGSLQLRPVDVPTAIRLLCAATPAISRAAWVQYVPTLPYQPPCGQQQPADR